MTDRRAEGHHPHDLPRPEHPRPRLRRDRWVNLNGVWDFAIDEADAVVSGAAGVVAAGAPAAVAPGTPRRDFPLRILVPFAPESRASGIGRRDFMTGVWYRRRVTVPADWGGAAPVLRIGAADYRTRVFVGGALAHEHWGGSTRIDVDLAPYAGQGDTVELVLHCLDDVRSGLQPGGKQSSLAESHGCFYTRVTGVWQTVWLEAVPDGGLDDVHIAASAAERRALISPTLRRWAAAPADGAPGADAAVGARHAARRLRATLRDGQRVIATAEAPAASGRTLVLDAPDARPWRPGDPALYDLDLELLDEDGAQLDRAASYLGFRDVEVRGGRLLLNGAPMPRRLVLDQGYWPESLWTAPSDEALRRDVELGMALGFDGARLHQKVFEPRYHYWADRLGYLTWAEYPSWGLDLASPEAARNVLSEWGEVVRELRQHPSIVAWTPFNETDPAAARDPQHHRTVRDAARLARALDPTRPVNDASGWVHVDPDLWTVHHYTQDPDELERLLAAYPDVARQQPALEPPYAGQPFVLAEFGGIKWIPEDDAGRSGGWGYGDDPADEAAFLERLRKLLRIAERHPHVAAFCYTQLTDVEQERNGLLDAERRPKFSLAVLRAIVRGEGAARVVGNG